MFKLKIEQPYSELSPFSVHFVTFILHPNLDITVQIIAYTADGVLSQTYLVTNMSAVFLLIK